ncbi:signal recognition particle-docking protein FtsY [archaeon]|jgi:fused signal recognition particle receptor|nr:signal recognition particle-docking protein FtsY [archaeon]MBT6762682.1 signal recognition particle-docking protein FtsY [archaeon]
MFGKLKDKLKKTFSIFSKKVEEEIEAEVESVEAKETEQPVEVSDENALELSKAEILDEVSDESIVSEDDKVVLEEKENDKEVVLQEVDAVEVESEVEELVEEKVADLVDESGESLPTADELLSLDLDESKEETKDASEVEVADEIAPEPSKAELLDLDADEEIDSEEHKEAVEENVELILETVKEVVPETKEEIESAETIEAIESESVIKAEEKKILEEPVAEKKSFFSKIKEKLTTKTINLEKFEELFWDLEIVLLESNVSVKVIDRIKSDLSLELVDKPLPRDVAKKIQEVLATTLRDILSIDTKDLLAEIAEFKKEEKPYTIIFFGINGSGKTTTIAKLTHLLKSKGLSVVLAAGDTFRAAAIDQLQDHADKLETKLIKHDYGSDAAAVAFDAKKYAEKNNIDVVLIDTAGRLHSNTNLMAELEKMMRVAKPDCKIFIGESITGNDCVEQAEKYESTLGIDGVILTKADIDEMGGAPLSICYVTGKPILYLGMGQEYQDLLPFSVDLILEKLGIEE